MWLLYVVLGCSLSVRGDGTCFPLHTLHLGIGVHVACPSPAPGRGTILGCVLCDAPKYTKMSHLGPVLLGILCAPLYTGGLCRRPPTLLSFHTRMALCTGVPCVCCEPPSGHVLESCAFLYVLSNGIATGVSLSVVCLHESDITPRMCNAWDSERALLTVMCVHGIWASLRQYHECVCGTLVYALLV